VEPEEMFDAITGGEVLLEEFVAWVESLKTGTVPPAAPDPNAN
jgi:hypothetical protein